MSVGSNSRNLFEELLKFHGSRHATSVNLMTVMGSIVIIAKIRPSFMPKVVTAIEKLNGKSTSAFELRRFHEIML